MKNNFTILIVGSDCESFIKTCIKSCVYQNFNTENFSVLFSDDCSKDSTFKLAKALESKYCNLKVVQTPFKSYKNLNIKISLEKYVSKESIVVLVDADDWLAHTGVLNILEREYQNDIWLTYGLYEEFPYKDVSDHYKSYSQETVRGNLFRKDGWLASHLGTFKRDLYLKIKEEDLKDETGNYLEMTGDMAMMFPMLEMAGSRSKFINEVLYIYNRTNSLSDDKINSKRQSQLESYLRNKQPYQPLNEL